MIIYVLIVIVSIILAISFTVLKNKKIAKTISIILSVIILAFLVLLGVFYYQINYKETVQAGSVSPDGKYELQMKSVGEPVFFSSAKGKFVLLEDGKEIASTHFTLFDDGGSIRSDCWDVTWEESLVRIIIDGDEMDPVVYEMHFDGTVEANVVAEEAQVPQDEITSDNSITQSGPYGSIKINIPEHWTGIARPVASADLRSVTYGIQLIPDGTQEGCIEVGYNDRFGVCGTGLKEEKYTFAGDEATVGYYDGSSKWDFVNYNGKNEGVIAMTVETEGWSDALLADAFLILNTLEFNPNEAEGVVWIFDSEEELPDYCLDVSMTDVTTTGAVVSFNQYDEQMNEEFTFGEQFALEKEEGGSWVEIPTILDRDNGFEDIAYSIPLGEITGHAYDWEWLYGELPAGDYRMKIPVYVTGKDTQTVYVHFIVRNQS